MHLHENSNPVRDSKIRWQCSVANRARLTCWNCKRRPWQS
jgi:hypothetical protein